jgi:hypothetical protein
VFCYLWAGFGNSHVHALHQEAGKLRCWRISMRIFAFLLTPLRSKLGGAGSMRDAPSPHTWCSSGTLFGQPSPKLLAPTPRLCLMRRVKVPHSVALYCAVTATAQGSLPALVTAITSLQHFFERHWATALVVHCLALCTSCKVRHT